jgi:hypothetical protein
MNGVYVCNIGTIEYAGKMLRHEVDAGILYILHYIQIIRKVRFDFLRLRHQIALSPVCYVAYCSAEIIHRGSSSGFAVSSSALIMRVN